MADHVKALITAIVVGGLVPVVVLVVSSIVGGLGSTATFVVFVVSVVVVTLLLARSFVLYRKQSGRRSA